MSDSFRVVGARELLATPVFSVRELTVAGDATTFTRVIAAHEGAVAVMAVDARGRVGMLRQYRATFDNVTWELPAGTRDVAGEDPRDTAQRELREELGCRAGTITELYRYMNSRGWTNQTTIVYEATDLSFEERAPDGPEEHASEVHWLDEVELRRILASGECIESSTLIGLIHRLGGTA